MTRAPVWMVVALAGCGGAPASTIDAASAIDGPATYGTADDATVITYDLDHVEFGTQEYVHIHGTTADFDLSRFDAPTYRATVTLTHDDVQAIVAAFEQARFLSVPDPDLHCSPSATLHQYLHLELAVGARTIEDLPECAAPADQLEAMLAQVIRTRSGYAAWTGTVGQGP